MNWFTPPTEDRAVSPVVGVALLIAIAVILAAVIGAVVLGIGVGMAEAPQASLAFEATEDNGDYDELKIEHTGGDALPADEFVLRGDGLAEEYELDDWHNAGETLSAGETATIDFDDTDGPEADEPGEVSVVWQDPNSDDESVIGSTTLDDLTE